MFRDFYTYSAEALLLGGGALQVLTTQIDTDADFAVLQQVCTAIDRRAHVQQVETSSGRMIHDVQNLPLCNVFGTGRFPYRLPVSLILNLGTLFNTQVTDESGAGNQIRFAYHGVKLFQTAPYVLPTYTDKRLFTYSANFVAVGVDTTGLGAIPAGGRADYSLRIQPDADFEWDKIAITYDLPIPAATDTIATVQIRDESLGRYFSDRPIPVESFSGCRIADVLGPAGFNPYVLPQAKMFKAGTLITLTVRNQDPANALGIRFSFMGKKCYI